jgi:hypothetical protein
MLYLYHSSSLTWRIEYGVAKSDPKDWTVAENEKPLPQLMVRIQTHHTPTLLPYTPLLHSSHTLLSYTPPIHSSPTLLSYTPLLHSSPTLLSYTPLLHSFPTLLSYISPTLSHTSPLYTLLLSYNSLRCISSGKRDSPNYRRCIRSGIACIERMSV